MTNLIVIKLSGRQYTTNIAPIKTNKLNEKLSIGCTAIEKLSSIRVRKEAMIKNFQGDETSMKVNVVVISNV